VSKANLGRVWLFGVVLILLTGVGVPPVLPQSPPPPPFSLVADLNGDGFVDGADMVVFREAWRDWKIRGVLNANADLNGDKKIDYFDALQMCQYVLNPETAVGVWGTVVGTLQLAAPASEYEALLDGSPVPWTVAAGGAFGVGDVPPGDHVLSVVRRGSPEGVHIPVSVSKGKRVVLPDPLRPVPGGQIGGLVIDGVANKALVGAQVVVVPARLRNLEPTSDTTANDDGIEVLPRPPQLILQAITDANGGYLILAAPTGLCRVTVSAAGYRPQNRLMLLEPGRTTTADFRLRPRQ